MLNDPKIAKAILMIRVYRWFLALLTLLVRYVYAYYNGHNMLESSSYNAGYFLWSVLLALAVYMVALPAKRTTTKNPQQRRADREDDEAPFIERRSRRSDHIEKPVIDNESELQHEKA